MVGPELSKQQVSEGGAMTQVRAHHLANLTQTFLTNCMKSIIMMREALDRVDFETVENLAHRMSGTAAMLGLQFICETGVAIEQAAKSSNLDASRELVGKLFNHLDDIDTDCGTVGNSGETS